MRRLVNFLLALSFLTGLKVDDKLRLKVLEDLLTLLLMRKSFSSLVD
jgi:hypothetical protein